ncbi:MAG: pyrroline-5-carboxylate reductase [Nitrospirae bacterium]|nr:pyrroline-5-carboxylate reductase [Nitrospirota bacterium]
MTKKSMRLGIIGCGQMGEALLRGMLTAKLVTPDRVLATDLAEERMKTIVQRYGIHGMRDGRAVAKGADVLLLAVKPQGVNELFAQLRGAVSDRMLVISVITGVQLIRLEAELGGKAHVVRAVPNTPTLVGCGMTAVAGGAHASADDLRTAVDLFNAVGATLVVEERHLDAVTGLSGSGPAYAFVMIEALADGGVKAGLSREVALQLAARTLLGAAQLLLQTGEHPGQLKDRVASPGGTTIAGLRELEAGGVRAALINAVEAATRRAAELGQGRK